VYRRTMGKQPQDAVSDTAHRQHVEYAMHRCTMGKRSGPAEDEDEEELEAEERARWHLRLGHPKKLQERQVREERGAEKIALDSLPLRARHPEGVHQVHGQRASRWRAGYCAPPAPWT